MNRPEGRYPIPRPTSGDDPRSCLDPHHWKRALFDAIYQEHSR